MDKEQLLEIIATETKATTILFLNRLRRELPDLEYVFFSPITRVAVDCLPVAGLTVGLMIGTSLGIEVELDEAVKVVSEKWEEDLLFSELMSLVCWGYENLAEEEKAE